jgi:hypothetical protein
VRLQRAGANPYLEKAKENYQKIKAAGHYNTTPTSQKREEKVKNFLAAIDQVKLNGQEMSETNLLAAYKEKMGSNRIRTLPKDDIERGLFYTVDEIVNNPPINIETERMKRGFARKQFERVKPFLKDSFTNSHPGAPPPYPTFNDLKSWGEHGSERPASMSWTTPTGRSGGVTKAMPQEFYDSVAKGEDGKPKMPPGGLPLHLMPAWNYTVKKSMQTSDPRKKNPYATQLPDVGPASGKVAMGMQSEGQEGILYGALRKYVMMRGAGDLVDIPSVKLSEIGMSHQEIFKSKDGSKMSDRALNKLLQIKIVDPTALVPFIDAEIKSPTKKSFALMVDPNEKYIPGETMMPMEIVKKSAPAMVIDIKKARIEKIQRIIHARKSANS